MNELVKTNYIFEHHYNLLSPSCYLVVFYTPEKEVIPKPHIFNAAAFDEALNKADLDPNRPKIDASNFLIIIPLRNLTFDLASLWLDQICDFFGITTVILQKEAFDSYTSIDVYKLAEQLHFEVLIYA